MLALLVVRLWAWQIGASFWVDETVTAFVVHHGASDPSLAIAPQVPKSLYYAVARAANLLFGTREVAYRLPSILFSLATLGLVARLAARLIHPDAGWFAAMACFGLKTLNWEAADARPYAMGFLAMAAAALLLVRWLDSGRTRDAAAFVVVAALIWRIQLIFWPAYVVLALYAFTRLARGETGVTWLRAAAWFAGLGVLLVPVLVEAVALNRQAGEHVIVDEPTFGMLLRATQWKLIVECAIAAWIVARVTRVREALRPPNATLVLAIAWWLIPIAALFVFSQTTGNSVFVRRYYSIALPGAALAATCAAAWSLPKHCWKTAALVLGAGALAWFGARLESWPGSDWRGATAAVNALPPGTLVVTPSPFIEARWPVWRPRYSLPGFLYAEMDAYPVTQPVLLFPFHASTEAEQFGAEVIPRFLKAGRFAIYGGDRNVRFWSGWFLAHPELAGWSSRRLGSFGDVEAAVVEAPEGKVR